ncbi:immunoglobulin superfamily member 3-like isoform X2 [Hyla sarda]|uniref:immunoglobulin superfamily member 3-like isoform X2 n=1 Tax=Hyla sarda TaxID=327740 RepID=UPI0024C29D4A|nr:immunoglobulin superfamily member 3-like isoform X2 [Hyla sarda]
MERNAEHHPLHLVPPLYTGILWLSIVGVSWAQREVIVQQGPLYRTVGSHITIWCQVRGYQGPSEQTFQYSIYLPSAPDREVQIVSTKDTAFSYAIFSQRVRSGDIYIERVTGDHTLLHIRQLQERDAGEYECYTPNTDPSFYGSYSAKVNLSVLPDTLEVAMPGQELEKSSGASLEVTCRVSGSSSQHTHLAVSWFLTTEKDVDILSLSRDFVLVPGESFSERFISGDVRMDKLSDSLYRLSIRDLRSSDQGDLFCQGSEWIQDPDGKWTKITEKKSQKTTLKISASRGGDFQVEVEISGPSIRLRSPLEITCSVSAQGLVGGRFHVTWLLNGAMMATWDSSGISSFGTNSTPRGAKRQMSVMRQNQETWTLRIGQTSQQDGGSYLCDVMEEGTRRRRQSPPVSVTIETPESPTPSVALHSNVSVIYEGDSVTLFCQVSRVSESVDVTWLLMGPRGQWVEVASLRRNGAVEAVGEYIQRHVTGHLTAQRLSNGLHSLTLDNMAEGDGGQYSCRLTEFMMRPDDEWRNATYDSNRIQTDVRPLGSELKVVLRSRDQRVRSGAPVGLFCRVSAGYGLQDKLITWFWDFQPTSGSVRTLVNVSGDGGPFWDDSTRGFQGEAQISIVGQTNTLKIYRVQRQHQGAYSCRVTVRKRGVPAPPASASSITMNVNVQLPDKILKVAQENVSGAAGVGGDVVLRCPLEEVGSSAAIYSVSWYHQVAPLSHHNLLYRVSREGVTEYKEGLAERLQVVVAARGNYSLILRSVGPEDAGRYHCQVEEWRLQEDGWRLEALNTSGYLTLTVSAPEDRLSVNRTALTLVAPEGSSLALLCHVLSTSVSGSIFSVSWWKVLVPGHQLLFNASHLGQMVYPREEGLRLQYQRTSQQTFQLRILRTNQGDAGIYYCRIQEWGRAPRGGWYQIGQQRGGNVSVSIRAPGVSPPICLPPSLFYFLLLVFVLFLLLLVGLGWKLLTRWRNKMNTDQRGEGPKTEEAEPIQMQPMKELSH